MLKRILLTGALGGVVLVLWAFVANGIFGFTRAIEMNQIPNEHAVYSVLRETITAPGVYVANPEPTPGVGFPAGEPVFSIRYGGMGHEAAGSLFIGQLVLTFAASILVAGLLSATSANVLCRYTRKVFYIICIGLLLAVFGDLSKYGIGGYPASSALLLAANHVVSWSLAALVMAWSMRPSGGTDETHHD